MEGRYTGLGMNLIALSVDGGTILSIGLAFEIALDRLYPIFGFKGEK